MTDERLRQAVENICRIMETTRVDRDDLVLVQFRVRNDEVPEIVEFMRNFTKVGPW